MKKKTERPLNNPEIFCPVRQTIRVLGKRWTILIIKEIYYSQGQRLSFMQLRKRLVNASAKVLSERLKEMAKEGFVNRREDKKAKPTRVYYTLTGKGSDACSIVDAFKDYGLKWKNKDTLDCSKITCELCAQNRGLT